MWAMWFEPSLTMSLAEALAAALSMYVFGSAMGVFICKRQ